MTDANALFKQARIPQTVWDKRLSAHRHGKTLTDLVNDTNFRKSVGGGAGVNVCSADPSKRMQVFPLFARSLALYVPITYVSVLTLCHICTVDNHPLYEETLSRVLAIQGMHDESHPFPFSHLDRYGIENFLMERSERGLANVYCSQHRLVDMRTWWTDNFLHHQMQYLTDVVI